MFARVHHVFSCTQKCHGNRLKVKDVSRSLRQPFPVVAAKLYEALKWPVGEV